MPCPSGRYPFGHHSRVPTVTPYTPATRLGEPARSRTRDYYHAQTHPVSGCYSRLFQSSPAIPAGTKSLAPHAGRPPQEARGTRRCRGKSREQRGDGKGLHNAYPAAVRVLLSKSTQHADMDTGHHGSDPDRRVCPGRQVQPENDRRTDEDRYGGRHWSNTPRISARLCQGRPETFGCQSVRDQKTDR